MVGYLSWVGIGSTQPLESGRPLVYLIPSHFRVIKILDGKGGGKGTRLNAKVSSLKDISKAEKLVANFFLS